MIEMVIILFLNFRLCKIRYRAENLFDQKKGTKESLCTLRFFKLGKKNFFLNIFFIIIKIQELTDLP